MENKIECLTIKQASDRYRLSQHYIRNLVKSERIRTIDPTIRTYLINTRDIEAFLNGETAEKGAKK